MSESCPKGDPKGGRHVWYDTEIGCEDCGSHPAVECANCDLVIDLVMEDDPR